MLPSSLFPRRRSTHPESGPIEKFVDGSMEADLPMQQISELFNINHFIVSQVREGGPHDESLADHRNLSVRHSETCTYNVSSSTVNRRSTGYACAPIAGIKFSSRKKSGVLATKRRPIEWVW